MLFLGFVCNILVYNSASRLLLEYFTTALERGAGQRACVQVDRASGIATLLKQQSDSAQGFSGSGSES